MSAKLLSIIIPTYNMEKYLSRCLDSLLSCEDSMLDSLDVMVINDGSKDLSSSIAHLYESKYPGVIKVIDKPNGNYGSCINVGLANANGKYVKVLDADDTFDSANFSGFLDVLSKTDVDCVLSDMMKVHENGDVVSISNYYDLPINRTFGIADLGHYAWTMWMHCVCFRTEMVRSIEYHQTEGISYTDQEWIFMPMSVVNTLIYYPKVVYRYLVGRDGQTINPVTWDKNFWQEIKGLRVMMAEFFELSETINSDNKEYLRTRLYARIRTAYMAFFLYLNSFRNNDLMRDFDTMVREFDYVYYSGFEDYHISRVFPFHYIKAWRRNYKCSLLIKLNRYVYKLLSILKGTEY